MPPPHPEVRTTIYRAVGEIRESLFRVADSARPLSECPHVQDYLQTAIFNLGQAEYELIDQPAKGAHTWS